MSTMNIVSFSGGKTSAYMAKCIKDSGEDAIYLFANTGQEHALTLEFIHKCDIEWNLNIVWLEAEVQHEERIGTKFKIVTYETAARNGEPFEEVIRKYGIPNMAYPHCTRELKLAPINSYVASLGIDNYNMLVGIRSDERRRQVPVEKRGNIVYPLIDRWPTTNNMVNEWWSNQTFNLEIEPYQGNCIWCWKKSMTKHMALMQTPEVFNFPLRMEAKYPTAGHNIDGTPRVFFRGGMSTQDLFDIYKEEQSVGGCFDFENTGVSESCDIYSECDIEKCSGL